MISEVDVNDWKSEYEQCKTPVKLYDVPRGSVVTIDSMDNSSLPIYFDHIDGMYSFCRLFNKPTEVVHLAAWQEVILWKKKDA